MGVFLVTDVYTDTTESWLAGWTQRLPVPLGSGRVAVIANRDVADVGNVMVLAEIYTLTATGWDRSPASDLDTHLQSWLPFAAALAAAATAEGNILILTDGRLADPEDILYGQCAGGCYVIDVKLDQLTVDSDEDGVIDGLIPHVPDWVTDPANNSANGRLVTSPDAMTRIPGTNKFWTWRYYPQSATALIDYIDVTGLEATRQHTTPVYTGTPADPPQSPRAIIPITATDAITALALPNGDIQLIHLAVDPAGITAQTQTVTGYPLAHDLTLYPGPTHDAEMLLRAAPTATTIARIGITWSPDDQTFQLTALPLTQLPATLTPPNYSIRRPATAGLSLHDGAVYTVVEDALYVARDYRDDGSDDNWILITQYNLTTGQIIANTWTKGGYQGARGETLYVAHPALAYEPATQQLLWTSSEGGDARTATFRVSYVLSSALRTERAAFMPV